MEGDAVWVAETWKAHGYDHVVQGVYNSREAAFEGLKSEPNLTVYVGADKCLRAKPRHEDRWDARWGAARPFKVRGRECTPTATPSEAAAASQPPGSSP